MTATERGPSSFAMPRPGGATPPGSGEDWMPEEPGEELLADDAAVDLDAERAESRVDEVLDELDRELVGLVAVKTRIREIAALLLVDRLRNRFGLASSRPTLHMCFTGPPGTGKTTVAMRLARLLSNLGYLTSGHLVTATRDDLVGQYVGHTAPKTREVLKRAMGGVLFIDEAYYLYRAENERDYGQEAIEILLQVMEAQREDVVVVLAGYKDRMDTFFQSNPGMHSRIAHHIDFPNYTLDELDAIGHLMLAKERYELSEEAEVIFREYLSRRMRQPRFANARSVRNALERARLRQANRLMNRSGTLTKADLVRIEADDFRASRVFDDGDDFVETGAGPAQDGGGARGGGTRGGSGARRRSPKAVTGDGGAEAQAQRTVRPPKRPAARPIATQAPARSRAAGE